MKSWQDNRRIIVYFSCLVLLVIAVIARRTEVTRQREAVPLSYITEVERHGRPVTAMTAETGIFLVEKKITVVPLSGRRFEGYATSEMAAIMSEGQRADIYKGEKIFTGRLSFLDPDRDQASGLHRLEIKVKSHEPPDDPRLLARVNTEKIADVIAVPNEVLEVEKGVFYLWKIVEGKASRHKVEIAERSGNLSVVSSGLSHGDVVIVTGQSILEDGDSVRVMSEHENMSREM